MNYFTLVPNLFVASSGQSLLKNGFFGDKKSKLLYLIVFQLNFPIAPNVVTPAFDPSREPPVYPNPVEESQPPWEYKPAESQPHFYPPGPPPHQQPPLNMAPPPHMGIPPPTVQGMPLNMNRPPPRYPLHGMDRPMMRGPPPPHTAIPPPVISLVGSAPVIHPQGAPGEPLTPNLVCFASIFVSL